MDASTVKKDNEIAPSCRNIQQEGAMLSVDTGINNSPL